MNELEKVLLTLNWERHEQIFSVCHKGRGFVLEIDDNGVPWLHGYGRYAVENLKIWPLNTRTKSVNSGVLPTFRIRLSREFLSELIRKMWEL